MSKNYKIIKGKIITGSRTLEQIKEANRGQGMSEEDFQNIQKAYEHFNGAIALFRLWKIDHFKTYYLIGCDKEFNEQIMLGMYYAEQTNPFQDEYKDNLVQFKADWTTGRYDPQCAFALDEQDIEVIEELTGAGDSE